MIVKATKSDVNNIVIIHNDAFNGFFLTQLGSNFLKYYYTSVMRAKKGIVLGYYDDRGKLQGFCAAALRSRGFNKNIVLNNIVPFAFVSLRLLFTNPKSIVRLIENFTKKSPEVPDAGEYAELLSIAVNSKMHGSGIGKMLMTELEKYVKSKGIIKLSLTTDFFNNEKTLAFYKSSGYEIMYDFITYPNRKMYRLIKNL